MRKYIWYALGEILLVMIGILLALQVNNWNEEKKLRSVEKNYIELLTRDLTADSLSLNQLITFSDNSVKSKTIVLDYINGVIEKPDSLDTYFLRAAFSGIDSFGPNMGAFNEIQSGGGLSLIKNEGVRNTILTLYNKYEEMDENLSNYYLTNRWETRDLVYEKANGNLFLTSESLYDDVLEELLEDGEIKGRIINNWSITYNRELKILAQLNAEALEECKSYLSTFN